MITKEEACFLAALVNQIGFLAQQARQGTIPGQYTREQVCSNISYVCNLYRGVQLDTLYRKLQEQGNS